MRTFTHEKFGLIRTIKNEKDEPYFCGNDLARILKFSNSISILETLCKNILTISMPHPYIPDQEIELLFISEDDVYTLLWKSNLSYIDEFEKWLHVNVIKACKAPSKTIIEKIAFNEDYGAIRIQEVDETLYFCGIDIVRALAFTKGNQCIAEFCKGQINLSTPIASGLQDVVYIPESDIYRLISQSKLRSVAKFESWIFDEVIPQLNQTHHYYQQKKNLQEQEQKEIVQYNIKQQDIIASQQATITQQMEENQKLRKKLEECQAEVKQLQELAEQQKTILHQQQKQLQKKQKENMEAELPLFSSLSEEPLPKEETLSKLLSHIKNNDTQTDNIENPAHSDNSEPYFIADPNFDDTLIPLKEVARQYHTTQKKILSNLAIVTYSEAPNTPPIPGLAMIHVKDREKYISKRHFLLLEKMNIF